MAKKTKAAAGRHARNKGKSGELEVRDLLRKYGVPARRGQQFRGGPGTPDVIHGLEGIHVEVKRVESFSLYPALAQAKDEADEGDTPVVFHRRNEKRWVVVLDAEDFLDMVVPEWMR